MRLPVDGKTARLAVMLAGSAVALGAAPPAMAGFKIPFFGGKKTLPPAPAMPDQPRATSGPAADYPVVLGDAYRVGDRVFTPSNAMNYDAVGYAAVGGASAGISAAHHTLPLPSYVEVTSLATGRTILVRVERRGPMDSSHAIELSPAAAAQLGLVGDGQGAVRVRRVNPLESERAALRAGASVAERMVTPKALLAVLQRRLANDPMSSHAGASLTQMASAAADDDDDTAAKPAPAPKLPTPKLALAPVTRPAPAKVAPVAGPPAVGANFASNVSFTPIGQPAPAVPKAPAPKPVLAKAPVPAPVAKPAQLAIAKPVPEKSYLIQPLSRSGQGAKPSAIALEARVATMAKPALPPQAKAPAGGEALIIQVGAFADKAHAGAIARKAGGALSAAGSLWRVRMGPFSNRGEAEAALAKAKAAGYTDARIQHGG